jgi:hypothetical protein
MPVHIDEMVSEVTAEPEPRATAAGAVTVKWEEQERWRAARERMARDRCRLQAEDYDD